MGITFLVNLVMARILSVADYGLVGMITIFTNVSAILVDGGFGNALIQKKNPTQTDYSTIFIWNFGLAAVLYAALYFAAPLIAWFFREPELVGVARGLALVFVINSLIVTQVSRLRKLLAFRKLAVVNITAAVASGCVGILLAKSGFGVYALVWMQVAMCAIQLLMVSVAGKWRPSLIFSVATFKQLFSYGGYLLAANVLQVFCNNFQNVIIGRRFSVGQLGLYSQAQKIDNITSFQLPQILNQVMFPVYSQLQDDSRRLLEVLSMNLRVLAYAMFPILTLLILLAEPTFTLLYGAKWTAAAPYFQILCLGGYFVGLQYVDFYAVAAKGKSRELFWWSFYKWGVLLALILVGSQFGIFGLLGGLALSNFNIFIVNAVLASKYVGFKLRMHARILIPLFGAALLTGAVSYAAVSFCGINSWFILPIYAAIYLGVSVLFKARALRETLRALKHLKP
ncbi:MAG: lipopolysaccharide biosynthesis protein [Bacteroides sp.]|nr:lipopolysaccharide biosynthesis protein [Bacteroides sp.]